MSRRQDFSPKTRTFLGMVIVCLALLLLAGGWTIPFAFESFSILYKFGLEKIYLRTGKMLGITVVLLVFFQILLASRLAIPERIFTLKRLIILHRANGMAIGLLVISHPLLIKASESFTPYTFEKKYYPEFLGMGALAALLAMVLTAACRNFFRFSYANWLFQHRFGATLVILLLPAHVLFVSETFKAGLPRRAALVIFSLNLLLLVSIWLRRLFAQREK